MGNHGVAFRGFKQVLWSAVLPLLMLASSAVQAGYTYTPYHVTWLTGPASDADGSYTVIMGAVTFDHLAVYDTVVVASLSTRLNGSGSWVAVQSFTNLPIYITANGASINRTGQGNGTHNYKADYFIYGPYTGYQVTTDYHDVVVTLPGSGGNDGITAPPSEVTSVTAVGTLPMGMDVAANGDAVASVPLQLIPGVAGFQPGLGLAYSSGRSVDRLEQSLPEDTIGYGWRLSGLSQIRRCVVNQSSGASIGLSSSDSLCLDGMPLVRTNSTAHLTAGATYRTTIESYRNIEIKSDAGGIWFEVTAPDGTVLEYGNGNDSRVDHNGGVDYQWSVSKATDTSDDGNEITYSYYHDAAKGINYPINIEYEGAEIDFEYRARTDASAVSIGSASQTQSVFLHTVKVSMDNTPVREYRLLDEVVSSRRRLNKIQQCGYDENGGNLECLESTDINWNSNVQVSDITNGLGAINHFEYTTLTSGSGSLFTETPPGFSGSSAPTGTQVASGRSVVTRIRRDNGLGGLHNTRYAYLGTGLNSTKHWGFLGFFAQRIKDDQSGITTYIQYRQDYPYFGSVARVSQYDSTYSGSSETLTRTETAYTSHSESYTGGSTKLPYGLRNTSFIYESNSQIGVSETENTYSFDTPGYITQIINTSKTGTGSSSRGGTGGWGNVPNHTVSGVKSTVTNTSKFTNSTSGDWLIGFVHEVVTNSSGGSTVGSIEQNTTFSPDTGSLRVASFTRFPGNATLNLTTRYTYDSMGRRTKTDVSGANVALRDSQAGQLNGFDADRYPLNFTNDVNQSTTVSGCDLRFGRYTNVSDPNGRSTSSVFDNFGRRTSFTNSDGVTVTTTYTADTSISVNDATAAYKVQTDSPVSPISHSWYDKLGRVIRRETQSFNGTRYSRIDTWYDNQGRVQKQSLPHFTAPKYVPWPFNDTWYDNDNRVEKQSLPPFTAPKYVTPGYDLRGRVINVARPDGSSTATSYSVSSGNVIVTVTDNVKTAGGGSAGSQVKRSEYNVLGQLVSTTDAYGTSDAATVTYAYDANGNMTRATAPGSAVSTMEYDVAGNRTRLVGPDVGTVVTTYTALGQIKTNTDNKGQESTFLYDTLGRRTNRSTENSVGTVIETADWVWDATNGKGKLASKTDNDGFTETYNYNSDSKLSSVVTNITAIGAGSGINFTTSYTYDSSGRPLTTSYPGGYPVTRIYKTGTGYLSQLKNGSTVLQTYSATDAFGNVTSESYGNGVATTRAYDPETGQLTAIETDKGSTVIQDHDYAWRSNGTLESRIANPNSGITTTRKETFGYDAHNRLTLAETFINGSNTRDLTYSYNSLGNITGKTSSKVGDTDVTGYSYHSTKKHAVTSATINDGSGAVSHTLTYDDNGAITKYDRSGTSLDRHIQYNAANQPTKIVVGASLTDPNASAVDEFAYGPDGRRYTRKTTWVENGVTRSEDVSYIGDVEYITYVNNPTMLATYKTRVGNNIIHLLSIRPNPQYIPSWGYPFDQPYLYAQKGYPLSSIGRKMLL